VAQYEFSKPWDSEEALQKYPEQRIAYLFVHCESKSSQDVKLKRGFEELS
jgi:hypothetical protein